MLKKTLLLFILFSSSFSLYANKLFLTDTDWLKKNINNTSVRIIDMSDDTQYQRFHIPNAVHLPYAALNQRSKTGISISVGKERLQQILSILAIKNTDHIIIYDDMGGLHASRLFWDLEKIGHKKISLLDGGLVKWIRDGNKISAEIPTAKKSHYQDNNNNRNITATFADVMQADKVPDQVLLDVRSQEEYVGHKKRQRSGHIPGAIWWEWQQAVDFDNAFKFQTKKTLQQQTAQLGLKNLETPIIVYCQSGHRAAHSYFTLRSLGYNKVKLYDGSMAEYSQHKSAPLKQGMTP